MQNLSNLRQKKDNISNESTVRCKHCRKDINSNNYLIHQARCNMLSSRASFQSQPPEIERPPEIKPSQHQQQSPPFMPARKSEVRPMMRENNSNNQPPSRMFQNHRQQEVQKIPCPFCGYGQTLAQLDSHPLKCQHREEQCPECHLNFPRSLMQEHLSVCGNRRQHQNNHHNQHHHHNHNPFVPIEEDYDDQEQEGYNPFGNFRNFFNLPLNRNRNSLRRPNQEEVPGQRNNGPRLIMLESRDPNGNVMRRAVPIGQMGRQGGRGAYSPFNEFFALIQMMAGRHAQREQGLTKDEIRGLKRVVYNGNNFSKDQNEKDLCTICYCEFEKQQKLIELKCKHLYHEECITKWVERTAKCPVCKAPQTDRPIFQEEDEDM